MSYLQSVAELVYCVTCKSEHIKNRFIYRPLSASTKCSEPWLLQSFHGRVAVCGGGARLYWTLASEGADVYRMIQQNLSHRHLIEAHGVYPCLFSNPLYRFIHSTETLDENTRRKHVRG